MGPGVCPKAVAKGFRCIFSNQGVWYLDHVDVPWNEFYTAEPLQDIVDASQRKLVIGGEVCMWSEVADTSNVQQTIWPRAAAAAGTHLTMVNHPFFATLSLSASEYIACSYVLALLLLLWTVSSKWIQSCSPKVNICST